MKYIPFEETFDKPYLYRITSDAGGERLVEFKTRSNHRVVVRFDQTRNAVEVAFAIGAGGDEHRIREETLRIFSTVVHVIKDYMRDYPDVLRLTFTSEIDDDSRVNLYDRMAKKYLSANYTLRISNYAGQRYYHATRKS